jgi:hypothetical protein
MDRIYEIEMGNLQSYLERLQAKEVSGAEPFHTINNLRQKMPVTVMAEVRKVLVRFYPEANSLVFEELIKTAPEEPMLEVSRIFAEHRLCQLGEIDHMEQNRHPCCHDRHLRVIEGGGITEPAEAGELSSRHFQVV